MSISCPNKSSRDYKLLEKYYGPVKAMHFFVINNDTIPYITVAPNGKTSQLYTDLVDKVGEAEAVKRKIDLTFKPIKENLDINGEPTIDTIIKIDKAAQPLKHSIGSILSIFQKQRLIGSKRYHGNFWVKATNGEQNILIHNVNQIDKINQQFVAKFGNPILHLTKVGKGYIVEVNQETLDKFNATNKTKLGTFSEREQRTISDLNNARKWLKKRFGNDLAVQVYNDTMRVGGEVAHGFFNNLGIHLWNSAKQGTEYHEAFHGVFGLYLSEAQQQQILKQAKEKYGEELTDLELEEKLADDFQAYVKFRETRNLPQRIADFFRDLYNYIESIIRNKRTIAQIYSNIYSNNINKKFKRNISEIEGIKFRKMEGYSVEENLIVRNALIKLYLETKELAKRENQGDKKKKVSEDVIIKRVRNWFLTHAYNQNGKPVELKLAEKTFQLELAVADAQTDTDRAKALNNYVEFVKTHKIDSTAVSDIDTKFMSEKELTGFNEQMEDNHTIYLDIYDNFTPNKDITGLKNVTEPSWSDILTDGLKTMGRVAVYDQAEEDLLLSMISEDNMAEKIYNMSHFTESLKKKLAGDIKEFLHNVEVTSTNFLGFHNVIPFDELFLDISLALTSNNSFGFPVNNLSDMLTALRTYAQTKPHMMIVADKLEARMKYDSQFASKFYMTFKNTYNRFLTLSQEWDAEQKAFLFKIFETNRNQLTMRLKEQWRNNSLSVSSLTNPKAIYHRKRNKKLHVNQPHIKKAVLLYNEIVSNLNKVDESADKLAEFLDLFGIEIPKEHIREYLKTGDVVNNRHIKDRELLEYLVYPSKGEFGLTHLIKHFANITIGDRGFIIEKVHEIYNEVDNEIYSGEQSFGKMLNKFVNIERFYQTQDSGSFMNFMRKSIFPVNLPTMLSDQLSDIKNGQLLGSDYYQDVQFVPTKLYEDQNVLDYQSAYLSLFENEAVRDKFNWYDFESYKKKFENISKLDYANNTEVTTKKIRYNMFTNSGQDYAYFMLPTLGDRDRLGVFSMPKLDSFADNGVNLSFKQLVRGYIEQDLRRIQQANADINGGLPDEQLIEGYHYNPKKEGLRNKNGRAFEFLNVSGIDENQVIGTVGGKDVKLNSSQEEYLSVIQTKEQHNALMERLTNDFVHKVETNYVNREIRRLLDLGIFSWKNITKDGKTTTELVDRYGKSVDKLSDAKHDLDPLTVKKYDQFGSTRASLREFVKDYIQNQIVATNEMTKMLSLDRAFMKSYEDFNKRFGAMGTPGQQPLTEEDAVMLGYDDFGLPMEWTEATIEDLHNDYPQADEEFAQMVKTLPNGKKHYADNYKRDKVNKTDAFGVTSIHFGRRILQAMGQWSPQHEEAYNNYNSGPNGEFKYLNTKTGKYVMPVLMPLKPYYGGHHYQNGRMVNVMIKNSYQILLRDYTKNYPQLDKLRDMMENGVKDENDNIVQVDAVNTVSTRKLERHGMVNISTPDYKLTVSKLSGRKFRIPQILPEKHEKPIYGSQFRKDIIAGIKMAINYTMQASGLELTGKETYDLYHNAVTQMIRNSYDELMKELGADYAQQVKGELDTLIDQGASDKSIEGARTAYIAAHLSFLQNLRKILKEGTEGRDLSLNYDKALDIVWDDTLQEHRYEVPLSYPVYGRKFEQIIFSLFRNNVMTPRINGTTAVQIAEMGGHVQKGVNENDPKYLKFIREENGQIVGAEIAIKSSIAEQFGIKAGESLDTIPEELRQVVGYRIPTQGKNSMLPMVIKYVLPDSYDHAVLVPGNITTQMGSDYDVDKLFIMMPNLIGDRKFVDNYIDEHYYKKAKNILNGLSNKTNKDFYYTYKATRNRSDEYEWSEDQEMIAEAIDAYFKHTIKGRPAKAQDTIEANKNAPGTITFNDGVTVNTPFKLNRDQESALKAMGNFVTADYNDGNKTFSLKGYAGTGKTTILNILDEYAQMGYNNVVYSSPTHRANSVLRLKNRNANVFTLHSLFGLSPEMDLENFDARDAKFVQQRDVRLETNDLLIIDESSMINDKLYEFITEYAEKKKAKVIFVGDPEQIKPVKQVDKSKAFSNVDQSSELTIVERTGKNPLLKESTVIRTSTEAEPMTKISEVNADGEGVIYTESIREFLIKAVDLFKSPEFKKNPLLLRVLAGTNATVQKMNEQIRKGIWGKDYQNEYNTGEILMGYANWAIDYETKQPKISNGGDYIVQEVNRGTKNISGTVLQGYNLIIRDVLNPKSQPVRTFVISRDTSVAELEEIGANFEERRLYAASLPKRSREAALAWKDLSEWKNSFVSPVDIKYKGRTKIARTIDYGYAHTIHKSQGGTYKYSFVHDKSVQLGFPSDRELRKQLKYVGVTRAEKASIVLTEDVKSEGTVDDYLNSKIPVQEEEVDYTQKLVRAKAAKEVIESGDLSSLTTEELENLIIDISYGILTNKEHFADIVQPRDDDFLPKQAEYFKGEALDFSEPHTEEILEMRNKDGNNGIGIYANLLSGHNIVQFIKGTQLTKPIEFKVNGVEHTLQSLTNIYEWGENKGELISSNISRHLGIAVDNAKDPFMAFLNDNGITSYATGAMLTLGASLDVATWLRKQPFVEELTKRARIKGISTAQLRNESLDMLAEHNINIDRKSFGTSMDMLHVNFSRDSKGKYINIEGTKDTINEVLSNDTLKANQIKALNAFVYLSNIGNSLVKLNKVLMIDRISDMSSRAAIRNFQDNEVFVERQKDILIGDMDQYPITQAFSKYGIKGVMNFVKDNSLMVDFISNELSNLLKEGVGKNIIKKEIYDRLQQDILLNLFQAQGPTKEYFTVDKFNNLFKDPENNLVLRLRSIISEVPSITSNNFISQLREHRDNIKEDVDYVRLAISNDFKLSRDEREQLTDGLKSLLYESHFYTEDVELQNKISEFAKDIIIADIWQNGFTPSGASISDIVPIEFWVENNWIDFFVKLTVANKQGINLFEENFTASEFLDSFIANNYKMEGFVPELREDKQNVTISEDRSSLFVALKQTIEFNNGVENVPYQYIKVYNKKTKVYDLYKLSSENTNVYTFNIMQVKGEPYKFKEYNVYTNDKYNELYDGSVIHPKKSESTIIVGSKKTVLKPNNEIQEVIDSYFTSTGGGMQYSIGGFREYLLDKGYKKDFINTASYYYLLDLKNNHTPAVMKSNWKEGVERGNIIKDEDGEWHIAGLMPNAGGKGGHKYAFEQYYKSRYEYAVKYLPTYAKFAQVKSTIGENISPSEKSDFRQTVIDNMKKSMKGSSAEKHLDKEILKVKKATQFIGQGLGSTNKHRTSWGNRANTGKYKSNDVIMLAANGKRNGRFQPVMNGELQGEYKNIDKAIAVGASFVADTEEHLSKGSYNIGELELTEYLKSKGYNRKTIDGVGYWTTSVKPEQNNVLDEEDAGGETDGLANIFSKIAPETETDPTVDEEDAGGETEGFAAIFDKINPKPVQDMNKLVGDMTNEQKEAHKKNMKNEDGVNDIKCS